MLRVIGLALVSLLVLTGCQKKNTSASAFSADTVFSDDFNRADGSFPDSSDWFLSSGGGSAAIVSNKLKLSPSGSSAVYAGYNTLIAGGNVIVFTTFSWTTAPGSIPQFSVVGFANANSAASVTSYYLCGFDFSNTPVIEKNGSPVTVGTPVTFSTNQSITVALSVIGGEISCTIGGDVSQTLSYTDSSPLTSGYMGFVGGEPSSTNVSVDDFLIGTF